MTRKSGPRRREWLSKLSGPNGVEHEHGHNSIAGLGNITAWGSLGRLDDYVSQTVTAGQELARKLKECGDIRALRQSLHQEEHDGLMAAMTAIDVKEFLGPVWWFAVKAIAERSPPQEEADEVFRLFAETFYFERVMFFLRRCWEPSHSAGPQFGEWEPHADFLDIIADIADCATMPRKWASMNADVATLEPR